MFDTFEFDSGQFDSSGGNGSRANFMYLAIDDKNASISMESRSPRAVCDVKGPTVVFVPKFPS